MWLQLFPLALSCIPFLSWCFKVFYSIINSSTYKLFSCKFVIWSNMKILGMTWFSTKEDAERKLWAVLTRMWGLLVGSNKLWKETIIFPRSFIYFSFSLRLSCTMGTMVKGMRRWCNTWGWCAFHHIISQLKTALMISWEAAWDFWARWAPFRRCQLSSVQTIWMEARPVKSDKKLESWLNWPAL